LYQGDKLEAASRNAYRNLLQDTFASRLSLRIEQQLRSDARNDPELLYEGLKTYIMLHEPRHFDADAVKAFVTWDWESSLPRDTTVQQRKELEGHLSVLLENGDTAFAPAPPDSRLIAEARSAIARTPLASRIYNRLKRQGVASNQPEFTIAGAAGPSAELVFTRASGKPLTSGVPGLYSFNGYHKSFVSESARVTAKLADEEGWVLGTQGTSRLADLAAKARLLEDVRRLYLEDYARIWEAYINDIKLRRAENLRESTQLARILSAPDSPLPVLMRAIVKEVTLVQVDEQEKSMLDKVSENLKSKRDEYSKMFDKQKVLPAASPASRPENIVDQRFESLRRMVRSQGGGPAPIDAVTDLINQLNAHLAATETAVKGGNTPPPSELPNKIKVEGSRMPEPIRSMLLTLSGGGTAQAMGVTRANLSQAVKAQVYEFCSSAIAGRYPFSKGSPRDVTTADFARLFSAGGLFDDFFQKNLAQFVNTSTRPWSFRDLGEGRLGDSSGALAQFQRAQAIREVFFRGGQGTSMRLEFKPLSLDPSITLFTLDVDGQLVKYSHGPQVPVQVQWPGPRGTTQVRYQVSPASSGSSGDVFEGPWALFRMFDKVAIEPTGQPEKFIATFNVEGRRAQFEVSTSSVQNPFRLRELEQFQCPSQI
jgi:type VI secretion system protein ImpL